MRYVECMIWCCAGGGNAAGMQEKQVACGARED